ncbi:hypothetical protein SKAU_G00160460 [Synaphobranchus kaupii]|uniref:Uncharacterized protein n=1 Tax=Synaphobranchus kaupii TaxID=118154 RepID=A0A9Q1IYU6_SYNKA|nr:hypothetical protein SKAU_G00160460 [Synaphobranchus kaupii]
MAEVGQSDRSSPLAAGDVTDGAGLRAATGRIPSIIITSESSPAFLPFLRSSSRTSRARNTNVGLGMGSATVETQGLVQ